LPFLQAIIERDQRWAASLGPHRLVRDDGIRQDAARIIPVDLWRETIGVIIRLFPGIWVMPPHLHWIGFWTTRSARLISWLFAIPQPCRSGLEQNLEIHDAIYEVIAEKHGTMAKR
jgi:hypothetical protein